MPATTPTSMVPRVSSSSSSSRGHWSRSLASFAAFAVATLAFCGATLLFRFVREYLKLVRKGRRRRAESLAARLAEDTDTKVDGDANADTDGSDTKEATPTAADSTSSPTLSKADDADFADIDFDDFGDAQKENSAEANEMSGSKALEEDAPDADGTGSVKTLTVESEVTLNPEQWEDHEESSPQDAAKSSCTDEKSGGHPSGHVEEEASTGGTDSGTDSAHAGDIADSAFRTPVATKCRLADGESDELEGDYDGQIDSALKIIARLKREINDHSNEVSRAATPAPHQEEDAEGDDEFGGDDDGTPALGGSASSRRRRVSFSRLTSPAYTFSPHHGFTLGPTLSLNDSCSPRNSAYPGISRRFSLSDSFSSPRHSASPPPIDVFTCPPAAAVLTPKARAMTHRSSTLPRRGSSASVITTPASLNGSRGSTRRPSFGRPHTLASTFQVLDPLGCPMRRSSLTHSLSFSDAMPTRQRRDCVIEAIDEKPQKANTPSNVSKDLFALPTPTNTASHTLKDEIRSFLSADEDPKLDVYDAHEDGEQESDFALAKLARPCAPGKSPNLSTDLEPLVDAGDLELCEGDHDEIYVSTARDTDLAAPLIDGADDRVHVDSVALNDIPVDLAKSDSDAEGPSRTPNDSALSSAQCDLSTPMSSRDAADGAADDSEASSDSGASYESDDPTDDMAADSLARERDDSDPLSLIVRLKREISTHEQDTSSMFASMLHLPPRIAAATRHATGSVGARHGPMTPTRATVGRRHTTTTRTRHTRANSM